jgi:LysM repeat protein
MSQALIYTLLALALIFPLVGAAALRLLAARLSQPQLALLAALVFGAAIASVLVLARSNTESLRIGNLTLLLPIAAPTSPPEIALPVDLPPPTRPPLPTARPSRTPTLSATPPVADTAPLTDTGALSDTTDSEEPPASTPAPEPTSEPGATPEPPTATPAPPPAAGRTYTVQAGDTLRGIAEQFNVSVADLLEANNLTPEQADSLRPGQELKIP